jgi:hypothetical protein
MNDAVFDTLAAVALMCSGHFHGSFTGGAYNMVPAEGEWEAGFERCALVLKELDAEKARRAEAQKVEAADHDKARLANGLAAIQGKSFAPEPAPPPPKSQFGCINFINTGGNESTAVSEQ